MVDKYSLRVYDTELMSFSLYMDPLSGLVADDIIINERNKHLLPIGLQTSEKGIVSWLRGRVIPKNRAFVQEILKTLGLSPNDTKGIIDICKGLSLTDSFWIVPQGFDGKYEQYNLFENRFDEMLSLVAYTGVSSTTKAFSTSPELTTNGMLPKAWRYIEGKGIYLYKGGTSGAANAGREPYSEFYASQTANRMGLNHVSYDLENWKGITASVCKLFTDINTSFVPSARLIEVGTIKEVLNCYSRFGSAFTEQLKSMLVFDALIYNEDRHFGNFGILRDNRSGKIISPAPIFDNGLSLFNFAMPEDYKNLSEYAKTRTNPYGVPFESIVKELAGNTQRKQLLRMIDFKFEKHPKINLPGERLMAIEKFIKQRAKVLLKEIQPKSITIPII